MASKLVKYLTIFLLFLISVNVIFTVPGVNVLLVLNQIIENQVVTNKLSFILRYPPGIFFLGKLLLESFPIDIGIPLFYKQQVWPVYRFLVFSFYLLTWLAFILYSKMAKLIKKIGVLNISYYFFLSVSILLASVSLGFYEIAAAPFLILSLAFLSQKRIKMSLLFYQISIFFNSILIIFTPLYFLYIGTSSGNNKKTMFSNTLLFLVVNISLLYFYTLFLPIRFAPLYKTLKLSSEVFGFPWSISLIFKDIIEYSQIPNLTTKLSLLTISGIITSISIIALSIFLYKYVFKSNYRKKTIIISLVLINLIVLGLSKIFPLTLYLYLILIFFIVLFRTYYLNWKEKYKSIEAFIKSAFMIYLIAISFLPNIPEGNLLYLSVFALLYFFHKKDKLSALQLLAINILVFVNIFMYFGNAGISPVSGYYFKVFTAVMNLLFIFYSFKHLNNQTSIEYVKKILIVFLLLLNFSLIPTQGTSDTVSWSQYAIATIQEKNPFAAQALVDQRYPPLSTVIISIFSNLWGKTVGFRPSPLGISEVSLDYALSVKISVLAFYFITVFTYLKFSKNKNNSNLLIILTTFALIVQTQGLADLNIHVIPTLFMSFYLLYKKKYFLSGLFYGITCSIKWQPVILMPLFLAFIFDPWNNTKNIPKIALRFFAGFIIIPIFSWFMVYIQPDGTAAISRSFEYLIQGAPMLSGQALNINWIVTYFIHIFSPEKDVSLAHLEGLNRQVPTAIAPFIFQGILFLIFGFIVVFRFWISHKKNLERFISAALMIFFTHHILNKSAYEKHLFYTVALMLLLYLIKPKAQNRILLTLFDIMTIMNLILFYGFTGPKHINRMFWGFDITIAYSIFYVLVYIIIFLRYTKKGYLYS